MRSFALRLVPLAIAALAGCAQNSPAKPPTINNFPSPVPVDTRLARLDLALAATVTAAFTAPAAVVPVPLFVGVTRGVTNRDRELVEGSLFVADVTGAAAGEVWQVLDDGTAGAARDVRPYFAVLDGAPRGLALDQFDVKGTIGRLWIAAGRTLHVVSGRAAPGREIAAITLSAAIVPGGETLRALTAAPFGINLFAASDATIVRIDVAAAPTASAISRYATLAAGAPVAGLAVTPDGTLFIERADGTFETIPQALETLGPAGGTAPLALTGVSIATPAGLAANSAGDLVAADASNGRLLEIRPDGVFVTATAVATAGQLAAIAADPFVARVLFVTSEGAGAFGVRAVANRTLAGGAQPIFLNRCVACHEAGFDDAGLTLESGKARAQVVGVTACETEPVPACDLLFTSCANCPQPAPLARVAAGDPGSSYLVRKIEASQPGFDAQPANQCSPDVCGERMPQASFIRTALRRQEIDMIRAWIGAGAQDD